eukprot:3306877-Rhodomonas_salina.2
MTYAVRCAVLRSRMRGQAQQGSSELRQLGQVSLLPREIKCNARSPRTLCARNAVDFALSEPA